MRDSTAENTLLVFFHYYVIHSPGVVRIWQTAHGRVRIRTEKILNEREKKPRQIINK